MFRWFFNKRRANQSRNQAAAQKKRWAFRPEVVERLEDRVVPTLYDFAGGAQQGWTTGNLATTSQGYSSIGSTWSTGVAAPAGMSAVYGTTNNGSAGAENSFILSPVLNIGSTLSVSFNSFSNNE